MWIIFNTTDVVKRLSEENVLYRCQVCQGEKLVVQSIVLGIKQCQREWLQHVERMDTDRIQKQALKYRPKGKRSIGRPRKRSKEEHPLKELCLTLPYVNFIHVVSCLLCFCTA